MQDRILSLIGLAEKAGRLRSGEFASEKTIKGGDAFLVILASDASENTIKHFTDMCSYRGVPIYTYGTKEDLGRCTGKGSRAVIALTDEGFGNSLISRLEER